MTCSGGLRALNSVPNEAVGMIAPTVSVRSGDGQPFEVQAAVELSDTFAVEPLGDAVVGGRRVECREIQPSDSVTSLERA